MSWGPNVVDTPALLVVREVCVRCDVCCVDCVYLKWNVETSFFVSLWGRLYILIVRFLCLFMPFKFEREVSVKKGTFPRMWTLLFQWNTLKLQPKLQTLFVWEGRWPQVARPLSARRCQFAILLYFLGLQRTSSDSTLWLFTYRPSESCHCMTDIIGWRILIGWVAIKKGVGKMPSGEFVLQGSGAKGRPVTRKGKSLRLPGAGCHTSVFFVRWMPCYMFKLVVMCPKPQNLQSS